MTIIDSSRNHKKYASFFFEESMLSFSMFYSTKKLYFKEYDIQNVTYLTLRVHALFIGDQVPKQMHL